MDQIGEREPPGRSIFTFSSPFLLRMLTTPLNIPRARYCPSFVQLFRQPPEGVGRGKGTWQVKAVTLGPCFRRPDEAAAATRTWALMQTSQGHTGSPAASQRGGRDMKAGTPSPRRHGLCRHRHKGPELCVHRWRGQPTPSCSPCQPPPTPRAP